MISTFQFDEFELDADGLELRFRGEPVDLQPKARAVLNYLVRNPDRIIPAQEILDAVWVDVLVQRGSVHRAVLIIRSALDQCQPDGGIIETVGRVGYRFCAAVKIVAPDPGDTREGFIGRAALMETIQRLLRRSSSEGTRLVILHGPAGVGKSAVLAETKRIAAALGALSVGGRCSDSTASTPYRPWLRVLRAFERKRGASELLNAIGERVGDIARAMPGISELPVLEGSASNEAGSDLRDRLFEAIAEWLRIASARVPMLVYFDDLHRADADSIGLLRYLIEELEEAPILFLCTARDPISGEDDPLATLAALRPSAPIAMAGFDLDETAAFLRDRMGAVSGAEVDRALDRSGGNPLFLEQIARDRRLLEGTPGAPGASMGLRSVFRRMVEDASEGCREVLEVAAVLGRQCDLRVLAICLEGNAAERDAIREARDRGILEPATGVLSSIRFVHGLIPEIIYADLPEPQRLALHRRVALAMRDKGRSDGPDASEFAHHCFAAASLFDPRVTFEAGRAAARVAANRLAYEEAVAHFDRALGMDGASTVSDSERVECLIEAGIAATACADLNAGRAYFEAACEIARRAGEPELFARAALGPADFEQFAELDRAPLALLEEAHAGLGAGTTDLHVQVAAALSRAHHLAGGDRAALVSVKALRQARALENPTVLVDALLTSALTADWSHRAFDGRAAVKEAIEIANQEAIHPVMRGRALRAGIVEALASADRGELDRGLMTLARHAGKFRLAAFEWTAIVYRTGLALAEGRHDAVRTLSASALSIARRCGSKAAEEATAAQHGRMQLDVGRLDAFMKGLPAMGDESLNASPYRASLAHVLCERGRFDEARRQIEQIVEADFAPKRRDASAMTASALAECVGSLGDETLAAVVDEELSRINDRLVLVGFSVGHHGAVERYRGHCAEVLGELDRAIDHYQAAIEIDGSMHAACYVARGRHDLARALAVRGRREDQDRARDLETAAFALAEGIGLRLLKEQCQSSGLL